MDYLFYLLIAVFLFFIVKQMLPAKGVETISVKELKGQLNDKGKQFIDVRTPAEFKSNHIKQFKNMPLHQLTQKADKELAKDKEVIVICQSGMRSLKASKLLKKAGFLNVTNVKGGMNAWY